MAISYNQLEDSNLNIRLLRLRQPQPHQPNTLGIELEEYPLADVHGQFIAVSHHWTSSTKPRWMNGKVFLVGDDLLRLLQQLKDVEASLISSIADFKGFWIDAICMNQDDDVRNAEKANQLRLMSQIYLNANYCLAVLGATDDKFLQSAIKHLQGGNAAQLRVLTASYSSSLSFRVEMHGLKRLFKLPYFRRVWILQEVILSERVRVLYGSDLVDWDELTVLSSSLHHLSEKPEQMSTNHRAWVASMMRTPAYSVIVERYKFRRSQQKPSIVDLIDRFCIWESTESVDRVLAHANLCSEDIVADRASKEKLYQRITSQVNLHGISDEVEEEFHKLLRHILRLSTLRSPSGNAANPTNTFFPEQPQALSTPVINGSVSNDTPGIPSDQIRPNALETLSESRRRRLEERLEISRQNAIIANRTPVPNAQSSPPIPVKSDLQVEKIRFPQTRTATNEVFGRQHHAISTQRRTNQFETLQPVMRYYDNSPSETHTQKRKAPATYIDPDSALLWGTSAFERRPVRG
ncbi:heterokaryon incompatibility protein-domain-containing protein [Astrocystis sublimbata]|nr:heterokaryon incompatibility protein-domain-containing protein [Astrocystis sublimbata]